MRACLDCLQHGLDEGVGHHDLQLAPDDLIQFSPPRLDPTHFRDGDTGKAVDSVQRVQYPVEHERLDDRFDLFHLALLQAFRRSGVRDRRTTHDE
jgi:hypothetical protein